MIRFRPRVDARDRDPHRVPKVGREDFDGEPRPRAIRDGRDHVLAAWEECHLQHTPVGLDVPAAEGDLVSLVPSLGEGDGTSEKSLCLDRREVGEGVAFGRR